MHNTFIAKVVSSLIFNKYFPVAFFGFPLGLCLRERNLPLCSLVSLTRLLGQASLVFCKKLKLVHSGAATKGRCKKMTLKKWPLAAPTEPEPARFSLKRDGKEEHSMKKRFPQILSIWENWILQGKRRKRGKKYKKHPFTLPETYNSHWHLWLLSQLFLPELCTLETFDKPSLAIFLQQEGGCVITQCYITIKTLGEKKIHGNWKEPSFQLHPWSLSITNTEL